MSTAIAVRAPMVGRPASPRPRWAKPGARSKAHARRARKRAERIAFRRETMTA